jgi:hypothetical protein
MRTGKKPERHHAAGTAAVFPRAQVHQSSQYPLAGPPAVLGHPCHERLHMRRRKAIKTRGRFMEVENRGRGLTPSATRSHSRTTFPSISLRLAPRPSRRAPSLAHPAEIPPRRPEQDVPHISGLSPKPQSSLLAPKQRSPPVHGCLSAAHHHGAIASSRAPCGTAVRVTVPPGQRTHTAVGTPDRPST